MDLLAMFGFLGFFGGIVGIIIGAVYATKDIKRRFSSEPQDAERLRMLEDEVRELSERVEFAERLLAQVRDADQLPPPA